MHGSDVTRLTRIIVQRPANLPDKDIQIRVDNEGLGPDQAEQFGLGNDFRPTLDQRAQEVEGLRGKVDFRLLAEQLPRRRIQGERAKTDAHDR